MSGLSTIAKQLDKSLFRTKLNVLALRIPAKSCQLFLKSFQPMNLLLGRPKLRAIVDDTSSASSGAETKQPPAVKQGERDPAATKLLLLNEKVKDLSELPEALRKLACDHGAEAVPFSLDMDYSHVSYEEALRRVLPEGLTIPTAFELAGHVAHLNLRDEQMPYRYIIGQVLLEKNPAVKSVVCKVGTIQNQFRVFDMEVIAGDKNLVTEMRQGGCRFRFDYSKVYWNSRLEAEHARLVSLFRPGEVICDMFCGVGPFAIPAAAKGCKVIANDLNPNSYQYLLENAKINKVSSLIHPFNMDAREFVRLLAAHQLAGRVPWFHHVVMNLPATAIEFLDVFPGLYASSSSSSDASFTLPTIEAKAPPAAARKPKAPAKAAAEGKGKGKGEEEDAAAGEAAERKRQLPERAADDSLADPRLPYVHCYCFSGEEDSAADVKKRVEAVLGIPLRVSHIHNVRNVAPKKDMLCVTFRLPAALAFGSGSTAAAPLGQLKRKAPEEGKGDGEGTTGTETSTAAAASTAASVESAPKKPRI